MHLYIHTYIYCIELLPSINHSKLLLATQDYHFNIF